MFKVYQHVLPNARAWRTTIDKRLRQLVAGLGDAADDVRAFYQGVYDDLLPPFTRSLDEWDEQFGLPANALTEDQRRDRLAATWKALGGQDPRYIQDTLQANGFDVYVHEWWEPGTEPPVGVPTPCATPRNPLNWLRKSQTQTKFQVTCGNPAATCGNPAATAGSTLEPRGYPLVNKISQTRPKYAVTCGNPAATCGNPSATCGQHSEFAEIQKDYVIPADPTKWPYFLYIGGQVFGSLATVDPRRKDEFEALCLKICPTQQWIGVLVTYS